MTSSTTLAAPDSIAQQHSAQLLSHITNQIVAAGGKISFADYMNLCLYTPALGYYSAGSHKLGKQGDFTTAPEISSLFSQSLAHHIQDVLRQITHSSILEFGAGSGKMAIDILLELERLNSLPEHYFIIEASADLQDRQNKLMAEQIPHLKQRVVWLNSMPQQFTGVIVANEVCDAMPVHRLHFNDGRVTERYIEQSDQGLQWCDHELSDPGLLKHADDIVRLIDNHDYITEVNLNAEAWINSLADSLQQGAIFLIDYGYSQTDYYHPQRNTGTLMCYFQHQGHDNPLILQGLQDITAHVNFTALAQTAFDSGLDVAAFQTQADFLIGGGITALMALAEQDNAMDTLQLATEIKQLTLPSAMGENFKALTLTKGLDQILPKIQLADRRYSL